MMSHKNEIRTQSTRKAVLELIAGQTETAAARQLTDRLHDIRSLWLLAKMSRSCENG